MTAEQVDVLLVEDKPSDVEVTPHALRSHVNVPRLVLLDIKLPKVDGLEVLRQLKADPRTRAFPVVMLTSSKLEWDVVTSHRGGVNSYVQKPVDFAQFRETVQQLGLYWLVKNESPPPRAFSAEPGP